MTDLMQDWAAIWGVPPEALEDLANRVTVALEPEHAVAAGKSEAYTQSLVRLAAPIAGYVLTRNNVGVLTDKTGRPVRYGLFNESKSLNETIKSPDLIGWRSITITPDMVGRNIAQFVGRECKREGWTFNPNDEHEKAQKRCIDMINAAGGDARFTVGGV